MPQPEEGAAPSRPPGAGGQPQRSFGGRGLAVLNPPSSGSAGEAAVPAGASGVLIVSCGRTCPAASSKHMPQLCCLHMESSEELESSLLTQPWASVRFGESTFLAKVCFRDTGYILLISDLSSVWYESAGVEAVGQRSKELNKRLTVHVSSFLNHLCSLMCPLLAGQPGATTAFSCQRSPSGLRLHVKSELSGLPFYWDFHCCPAPLEMVFRHLVRPLIQMNLALKCQVQELISLLLQKDAEIEDYRESGATLSRGRLRTEPFREETFQQNFMAEIFHSWFPGSSSRGQRGGQGGRANLLTWCQNGSMQ
ncbi:non-homologous end-joining factor 1 isoform X3 [Passer domesticus]|uniref:non-homologous end-joining factor 1 isoform X3 n=1 Tax=Passer domesticus TaxID=48849 RepID=UPI0030FE4FE1